MSRKILELALRTGRDTLSAAVRASATTARSARRVVPYDDVPAWAWPAGPATTKPAQTDAEPDGPAPTDPAPGLRDLPWILVLIDSAAPTPAVDGPGALPADRLLARALSSDPRFRTVPVAGPRLSSALEPGAAPAGVPPLAIVALQDAPDVAAAASWAADHGIPFIGVEPSRLVDTRAFAPRPASERFGRWSAVQPGRPLIGLRVGGDDFTPDRAEDLLRRWNHSPDQDGSGPAVVVPPALLPRFKALRKALPAMAGGLLLADPGPARRAVLLNSLTAVFTPGSPDADPGPPGSAASSDWLLEALASGVPVMAFETETGSRPALPESETLASMSRAARLEAARRFSEQALAQRVVSRLPLSVHAPRAMEPGGETPRIAVGESPQRIVVAGHNLGFAQQLIGHLENRGHEVRIDEWSGHARHNQAASRGLASWADAVFCEWTLGNAVWYSRNLPAATRLTTRLHLQEAALDFPGRLRMDRLDAMVFVADHVRRQVIRDHRVPFARTTVVPNAVEIPHNVPAKSPGQRFRLGLVGMVPARKGLHRALDLLELLRTDEPRFTLDLKGRRPDEYEWMRDRPQEDAYFRRQFERIENDPLLRGAVTFSPFGPDMAEWFSGIGVALSTSDFESFHFTLPDGAVHGAAPVSIAWPGADQLYPLDWLAPDTSGLAAKLQEFARDPEAWSAAAAAAGEFVADRYAAELVTPALARVVLGR